MNLPPELHKRLIDELRFAVNKMAEADSPHEKLYYFSVFFGEAVRVLNWHWDEELVLIWAVTQQTHNAVQQRLAASAQGERVLTLTRNFFNALTREAIASLDWIEKEGNEADLCGIVASLTEITYATTGNGFYLLGKGHYTLEK